MKNTIHILFVDNCIDTVNILKSEIENSSYAVNYHIVCLPEQFKIILKQNYFDLIFFKYTNEGFSHNDAIKIMEETGIFLPILIVSNLLGEKNAVTIMKSGVNDILYLDDLSHLIPSIELHLKNKNINYEIKKSLSLLKESEYRYKNVVDKIPDMILLCSSKGIIEICNQYTCTLTGNQTQQGIIGRPLSDYLIPSVEQVTKQKLMEMLISENVVTFPCFLVNNSAIKIPLEINSNLFYDDKGEIRGFILCGRNCSEQSRLKEQLRQAQKMEAIGQFAGGVAHDYNNFLTVLIGYASMLHEHLQNNPELITYVDHILDAAEKTAFTTKSLLAFSKMHTPEIVTLNLKKTIQSLTKFLSRIISESIELHTEFYKQDIYVQAGAGHIEQIIMNLVTNARDAMPKGGKLFIRTDIVNLPADNTLNYGSELFGECASISVQDTGIGMEEQMQQCIFEPFFTTKESNTSIGLGLSIVYGIVKQIKGTITIQSKINCGTTFTIYLPLSRTPQEQLTQRGKKDPSQAGGNETILLVEDDDNVRGLSAEILVDSGYKVLQASDGASAVKIFEKNRGKIDLLISDIIMPKKNGREVYEQILRHSPEGIRIIFMSGYTAEIIKNSGVFEQQVDFMTKPIFPSDLLRKVREVLDKTLVAPHHKQDIVSMS